MKKVIFTVTNDLNHDQRMMRICNSLAGSGYSVTLVGARYRHSGPLLPGNYQQKRLSPFFQKGFLFYATYNLRLFFFLLFKRADILCCIDLDTILPVWLSGALKNTLRVYDAHEYFSQQKEVITRPRVYRVWHWIEKTFVPRFKKGYTVSNSIAAAFKEKYGVDYDVIRNVPQLKDPVLPVARNKRIILYQGAVNESRGLEYLIPAMKVINAELHIYGDGNFLNQTKELISSNNLGDKVLLKGKVLPDELESVTANACIGINLVENSGLNQYFSLANKFFDYIHQGLPQLTMNFPEYRRINDEFEVALLIDETETEAIARALTRLLDDQDLYERLKQNCLAAREKYNWQQEEKKLIAFYDDLVH